MELLLMIPVSVVVAVVPALVFLWFVWWLDRYDREPWYLVAAAFAWGAVGAIGLAIVGSVSLAAPFAAVLDPSASWGLSVVAIAPLVEETAKGLVLLLLVLHRKFDGTIDGVVYGAAVGLGFAVTENVFYYLGVFAKGGAESWLVTVVIRTGCSTWMHALATATTGAAIGSIKFERSATVRYIVPVVGLVGAMLIHGVYNGAIAVAQWREIPALFAVDVVVLALELVVMFLLLQLALLRESATIAAELRDEVDRGHVAEGRLAVVPSYFARLVELWRGGVAGYDRNQRFFALATELALRKDELRRCSAEQAPALHVDVERLRRELAEFND